jgi:hypothetical protein
LRFCGSAALRLCGSFVFYGLILGVIARATQTKEKEKEKENENENDIY